MTPQPDRWLISALTGLTAPMDLRILATASALADAGFVDVGGTLGERPFTYCGCCRCYQHFNYWTRGRVIVTACTECGVVQVRERSAEYRAGFGGE
jgi:hypothetical protein